MRRYSILLSFCLLLSLGFTYDINTYTPDLGNYIGELIGSEVEVTGQVFVVNATTIQIFNFTMSPIEQDVYFWFDTKESPTRDGVKGHTFEYGITPIAAFPHSDRVVVHVPEKRRIDDFKSFSIYSFKTDKVVASIILPESLKIPKSVALSGEFAGKRYSLRSGPLFVLNRRTIKVYGFTFEGNKAPKTYFYAGRGATVSYASGVKVGIRGKDGDDISEINENYRGGKDIILELPENYDIFHIDWISVYCTKFRVNFGSVLVPSDDTLSSIPPYVPQPKSSDNSTTTMPRAVLRGIAQRRNFTFQIADTEHVRPNKGYPYMRPPKYVWYVNSVMTPDLYLQRNVTYTFNVEGGRDKMIAEFYNPLYIGDDVNGGYSQLSPNELERVKVYSNGGAESNAGPLCLWMHSPENSDDMYLNCDGWPKDEHTFTFTPNETTPSVLYYNSANNFNMGGRIFIVDEIPENLNDSTETPYSREKWRTLALTRQHEDKVNTTPRATIAAIMLIISTIIMV